MNRINNLQCEMYVIVPSGSRLHQMIKYYHIRKNKPSMFYEQRIKKHIDVVMKYINKRIARILKNHNYDYDSFMIIREGFGESARFKIKVDGVRIDDKQSEKYSGGTTVYSIADH